MFRSAILALLLVGVSSAFLYSDTRCHEGPSYWCSSHEVAEGCQATQFCETNYWKDAKYDENTGKLENYVTCKACMLAFAQVKTYVFNDKNEAKVIAGVTKLCDRIPAATMTEQCKTFIKSYGKMALDVVVEKVTPSLVCKAIKMCDAPAYEAVMLGKPSQETCSTCKSMADELTQELKGMVGWWSAHCNEAEIPQICEESSQYIGVALDVILNGDICEEMQMC